MGKTFTRQKTRDFDYDDLRFEKRTQKKPVSFNNKREKALNRVVECEDEFLHSANTKYDNTNRS